MPATRRAPSWRPFGTTRLRLHLMAATVAALAAMLPHLQSLQNPFVYDDYDTVVANPSLVPPMNLRFVLAHSPFRPVVNASYAVDRLLWGERLAGFHLTSVLLHTGVVVLIYALLVRAIGDIRRAAPRAHEQRTERDVWVAAVAATIFGVHPLGTESVGYVSGRSEVLCGIFVLASVLCARTVFVWHNRRAAGENADRVPILPAAAAVVFGALAALSKETAAALPVVLLAYDWLVLPGPRAARVARLKWLLLPLAIAGVALAAYRVVSLLNDGHRLHRPPHLNLLAQFIVIWRYIGLLLLPVGQAIMHGTREVRSMLDPVALTSGAGLVALAWGAFRLRGFTPLLPLGVIWFLAAIAPSSSLVALREMMAEHRAYLASIGLVLASAGAAMAHMEVRRRTQPVPPGYLWAAGAVIVVLAALTGARYQVWRDPVRLWSEAVGRASGMWEPHYALGDVLRMRGDCRAAIPEYERAVALNPRHRDAHTNLGICLGQTGRFDEAEAALRRALEIDPRYPRGYTNFAALAVARQDYELARAMYLETLGLDQRNVHARMQLAQLYERVFKDYRAAARMCGEARAIQPRTPGVAECVERNQRLAEQADGR